VAHDHAQTIDGRDNGGGSIPDRMIERLARARSRAEGAAGRCRSPGRASCRTARRRCGSTASRVPHGMIVAACNERGDAPGPSVQRDSLRSLPTA